MASLRKQPFKLQTVEFSAVGDEFIRVRGSANASRLSGGPLIAMSVSQGGA